MGDVTLTNDRKPWTPHTGNRSGPDTPVVTESILRRVVVETVHEDTVFWRLDGSVRLVFLPSILLTSTDPGEKVGDPRSVREDRQVTSPLLTPPTPHDVSQKKVTTTVETMPITSEDKRSLVVLTRYNRV